MLRLSCQVPALGPDEGGVATKNVGAAVDADAEFVAVGKGAAQGRLRVVGDQRGDRRRRWRCQVDNHFVAGTVGTPVAGGIGALDGNIVGASR